MTKEVNQATLMPTAAEKNVEASKKGLEQAEKQFNMWLKATGRVK